MGLQQRYNREWLGPFAPLTWLIIMLALPAAAAALAVPGQVGERAGIASILALGALASIAGNRWGLPVVLAASAALGGNVLPIVIDSSTSGRPLLYASVALVAVLPGVAALLMSIPTLLQALTGGISNLRISRLASNASTLAVAAWMLAPTILSNQSVLSPRAEVNAPVQVSAISAKGSDTLSAKPGIETSSVPAPVVWPISASDADPAIRRTSAAFSDE